jgi:PAS domain S-box-containing protein
LGAAGAEAAAIIVAREDGTITEASPAALELIGVTFDELRNAPRGAFSAQQTSPDEDAAIREQWSASGKPDIGGETTIRRADGGEVRIRYLVAREPSGDYLTVLVPVDGREDRPSTIYGLGDVLTAWRSAERRLEALVPGSVEWRAVTAEIMTLRATYQAEYEQKRRR